MHAPRILRIMIGSQGVSMPRFYFHLIGRTIERDDTGTELPSAAYAKREGGKFIGALLADGMLEKHDGTLMLEVTDESGLVLFHFDVTSRSEPMPRAA